MDPMSVLPGACRIVVDDGARLCAEGHEYADLDKIGEGATAKVYAGTASDGSRVALKVFPVAALLRRRFLAPLPPSPCFDDDSTPPPPPSPITATSRTALDDLRDEIILRAALPSHPSIVPYQAILANGKKVVLVMPLIPEPLLRRLPSGPGVVFACEPRTVDAASAHLLDLLGALCRLHGAGVAHFDIQPDNVRIGADGRAVLCDLGNFKRFSRQTLTASLHPSGAAAQPGPLVAGPYGSRAFSPPESFAGAFSPAAADVWALGVLACTALTGCLPFAPASTATAGAAEGDIGAAEHLVSEVQAGRVCIPESVLLPAAAAAAAEGRTLSPTPTPAALGSLLRGMLDVDPARRLTAEQALGHAWWRDASSRGGAV